MNKTITHANRTVASLNDKGNIERSIAQLLLLFTAIASSMSAILVGLQSTSSWALKHKTILTVVVGLLGGSCAISTSSASYLQSLSDDHFNCADKISDAAIDTIENVTAETNLTAARHYLRSLTNTANRCAN